MHPAEIAVIRWLNQVVIGLNLCPFASKPTGEKRVRFYVSEAHDEQDLLTELEKEMEFLSGKTPAEIETTLIIVVDLLKDFFDYNQFLTWVNPMIKRNHWQGVYQVASFHPHYCFAGAEPADVENLTNRAPFPILHIIREESLAKALEFFPEVDDIPNRNRLRVAQLTLHERHQLFPYLFNIPKG